MKLIYISLKDTDFHWTRSQHSCAIHFDAKCVFTKYIGYNQSKNTGTWKGRLKRFFVDPFAVELEKMVLISFEDIKKISNFLFYAQGRGSKIEPASPL